MKFLWRTVLNWVANCSGLWNDRNALGHYLVLRFGSWFSCVLVYLLLNKGYTCAFFFLFD